MALARRSLFGLLAGLPFLGAAKARPYAGDRIAPGAVWSIGERGPEMFVPRVADPYFSEGFFGGEIDRATLKRWGEQVKTRAISAVVEARNKRPAGPFVATDPPEAIDDRAMAWEG